MLPTIPERGVRTGIAMITPVRDEEHYIAQMIESVLSQTAQPDVWIIVDDGSTDSTSDIIARYAKHHPFIKQIRLPQRSSRNPGGEHVISYALSSLVLVEIEFIARFDADLILDQHYLANLLAEFRADPCLGIAGGGLYIVRQSSWELEECPDYHVRGALKMYRCRCFCDIGGLTSGIGWDTIDEIRAWIKGWRTRSFFQYRVVHRRPTGTAIRSSQIYWQRGKAEYYTWSHPLFVVGKALKLLRDTRSVVNSLSFLTGFIAAYVHRLSRLQDPVFTAARRNQQWKRLVCAMRLQHYSFQLSDIR
jgi:biofilm PGA synthesis N-glycosyltransferase PgaC